MPNRTFTKLLKVFKRFKYIFAGGLVLTILIIYYAFSIYYDLDSTDNKDEFWAKVAEFLLGIGSTLLGTLVLGGGLGTLFNLAMERIESEENEVKEKLRIRQETQEKNKLFRWEMQRKLQEVHDNVELARVLIKSHQSGKTYGEQIRNRIMPSLISLQEFKRRITYADDRALLRNSNYLNVSLTYMIAYLSVLIEEFEASYLKISNLQNYQDAIDQHRRTLFTEITTGDHDSSTEDKKKVAILESPEQHFKPGEIPVKIDAVWKELEKLFYLADFISELRTSKGVKSNYNSVFLIHYYHCLKMLKSQNSITNERLVSKPAFQENLARLERIEQIKSSDRPLTQKDSLIRKIIVEELHFDFEIKARSLSEK